MSGNFLPLHLESFLFSPAGYSYASIPFIFLFGLNEFSVRYTSALFGSFTIILVYFIVTKLFYDSKYRYDLALISSLFLSISPWHINLSRVATENTIVVFFISLGTLLFLHWKDKQHKLILLASFASFGVTLFIYQAPRAFLPLFIPLLLIVFIKKFSIKKLLFLAFLYILVILIPVILILTSPTLSQRVRMLSIFNFPETQLKLNEQIREEGTYADPFITRIFHNKLTNYSATFLLNYVNHFSYNFLLTDMGMPDRYKVPGFGLIYLLDIPFLLVGLISLFHTRKRLFLFFTCWIILVPIGSSLTYDDIPNLQRTLIVFPALSILTACGFLFIWNHISKRKFGLLPKTFIVIVIIFNLLFYLHQYYVHQINHHPWYRQEGYKDLVAQVNKLLPDYTKVVITDAEITPEIFFLFYTPVDPGLIQNVTKTNGWKSTGNNFGKYIFSKECPLHTDSGTDPVTQEHKKYLKADKNTLYVNHGTCPDDENFFRTISEIKRSDQTEVFKLVVPK